MESWSYFSPVPQWTPPWLNKDYKVQDQTILPRQKVILTLLEAMLNAQILDQVVYLALDQPLLEVLTSFKLTWKKLISTTTNFALQVLIQTKMQTYTRPQLLQVVRKRDKLYSSTELLTIAPLPTFANRDPLKKLPKDANKRHLPQ